MSAASESDARVQVIFEAEVDRIIKAVAQLAAESVQEGRQANHTAERALENFHVKLRKLMGAWV